jgi:hypothetical protein
MLFYDISKHYSRLVTSRFVNAVAAYLQLATDGIRKYAVKSISRYPHCRSKSGVFFGQYRG